jgi:hypothetical protein
MTKNSLTVVLILAASGCGSPGVVPSGFAGVYAATFSGTFTNTDPAAPSERYTDTATVTVTDKPERQVELRWQVGSNSPSGTLVFALTGSTGTVVQNTDASSNCFMGTLTNGNVQINCCEQCSITFSGKTFTQQQSGFYSGTTPQNVYYVGNYTGTWTSTGTN